MALACKNITDVINGQILFSKSDHVVTDIIFLRGRVGAFRRGLKKLSVRALPELVDQNSKTPLGVAKSSGCFLKVTPSTKYALKASYCRCVEFMGWRKKRAQFVSLSVELINI